jgi:hypothetical protein
MWLQYPPWAKSPQRPPFTRYFRDVTPTDGVFETDINGISVLGGPIDDRPPLRIRHADDRPQRLL